MSEVKLNLIDSQQVLHGAVHGSVADSCVAALSAEPETIAELAAAVTRYIKPLDDHSPFATFHSYVYSSPGSFRDAPLDPKPWDAGIVVIDLAARIVACESTYSMPGPSGEVRYHDGTESTDIPVLYRLPDDWLFVNSFEAYQWSRERHAEKRLAKNPFDVRHVLYGVPLLEFVVTECRTIDVSAVVADDDTREAALSVELCRIHSRWLTTPREDLEGHSPREVMLDKQDFIDFDLHTRSLQWTFQDEGPPCLSKDSHAYKFAGFGTHEWVIYYDLVRHLLWSALDLGRQTSDRELIDKAEVVGHSENSAGIHSQLSRMDAELARLAEIERDWLEQPQHEYDGRIPAILIENERRRLPIALRPRDMIIDEDCPMCQMFGDETTPLGMGVGFWHLDGCNMEDEFAFSPYKTLEEWEAENYRREQFNREFDLRGEERRQRNAGGETLEPGRFPEPDPFPGLEVDDVRLIAVEANDDDENELPQ